MLAGGEERAARRGADFIVSGDALVLLGEEFHGVAHAGEFEAGDADGARIFGAAGEDDLVEVFKEARDRDGDADFDRGAELDAFGHHLDKAAVDEVLFELEIGDAVAEQAADTVRLFEDRHRVAGAGELLRAGKAGGAGADDSDGLARLVRGHLRFDPAFLPALVDDRAFDRLDGDGLVDEVERAGRLARGGADAAGELREVVGRVEIVERGAPVVLVDEVVPVRDLVVHRAAVVTVWDAAVHAARRLALERGVIMRDDELAVVLQTLLRGVVGAILAIDFEEAGCLAHCGRTLTSEF